MISCLLKEWGWSELFVVKIFVPCWAFWSSAFQGWQSWTKPRNLLKISIPGLPYSPKIGERLRNIHYLKVFHTILELPKIVAQNINLYISGKGRDNIYQILQELVLLNMLTLELPKKLLKRRCLCLTQVLCKSIACLGICNFFTINSSLVWSMLFRRTVSKNNCSRPWLTVYF